MGLFTFVKVFGGWITLGVLYARYKREQKNMAADVWDKLPDETKRILWNNVRKLSDK